MLLPVLLLLLAGSFALWSDLHSAIGITSAARAGGLAALKDLRGYQTAMTPTQQAAALSLAAADATAAVNQEEDTTGSPNQYNTGTGCTGNCVSVSMTTWPSSGSSAFVVTVTGSVSPGVPFAGTPTVTATTSGLTDP